MKLSQQIALFVSIIVLITVLILVNKDGRSFGGESTNYATFKTASSTAYTVSNSSVRLLATTTDQTRVATLIQPTNCTISTAGVFLASARTAVINAGMVVTASSTLQLATYPNVPSLNGALHAITSAGTCTVLVTEWLQ